MEELTKSKRMLLMFLFLSGLSGRLSVFLYTTMCCECLFVCNQVNMCSSPESHCVHGVGSGGDLAIDQERRLKEAFV